MPNQIIIYEIRGMRSMFLLATAFLLCIAAAAQKIDDGLWNTGRAFSITAIPEDSVILQKQLCLVQIYPGFSVVKSEYEIQNSAKKTNYLEFLWPDTLTTKHRFFKSIHNLGSAGMKVLVGKDTIKPEIIQAGLVFQIDLQPGQSTTITTYQLTPNSQAKLSGDETVKELNGFVFSFDKWKHQGKREVFVQLAGGLTVNNLNGVYPSTVTGTMDKLKWAPDSLNETLVVWYEGQAPDYKFEKKVLPKQNLLFEDINGVETAFFEGSGFKPINKTDFTTNTRSTLGTIVYFIMFTVPWIFLIWFIIYLLKKPKKKLKS